MYPYLKNKVVIVDGHEAAGVYDLNKGSFSRINKSAATILNQLNGLTPLEQFSKEHNSFLQAAREKGLVDFHKEALLTPPTELKDVLRNLRPVKFAWIEITSKCNQLCKHCFLGDDLNRFPHIPKEKIFDLLKTLNATGARQVILSGGEPTVHPNFREILQEAGKYPFCLSLLTNGSTSQIFKYVDILKRFNVMIKIPVLGWGLSHDMMAGLKGGFEKTIQCIDRLLAEGIRVELGTTVTGINYKDISKIREFANSRKIRLEVSPVYSLGYAKSNYKEIHSVSTETIIEVCRQDKAAEIPLEEKPRSNPERIQYDIEATDYDSVNLKDYLTEHHECGQKIIAILSSGKVTPCLLLREDKFAIGNIFENSLDDILSRRSPQSENFAKLMPLKKIPGCTGCEARFVCKAGACPASTYAKLGTVQEKNPYFNKCYYANRHTRLEVGLEPLQSNA